MSLPWKRRTFLTTLGSVVSIAILKEGWQAFPGATLPKMVRLGPSVRIVGIGGAGCAVLDYLALTGADPADFVALDSDLETLGRSLAPTTIQIGSTLLRGLGAGYRPENGYRAAVENLVDITMELEGADLVIVTCGLAGGIGGGGAPVVAYAARVVCGAEVKVVAAAPVMQEGRRSDQNAKRALQRLHWAAGSVSTVSFPETLIPRYSYEVTCFERTAEMADRVLAARSMWLERYGGIA